MAFQSSFASSYLPRLTSSPVRTIMEASVNLITVPSLTTGSIACPRRGGKALPQLEDNCRIQELFCDLKNDVVSVADINMAFKSYSGER